PLIIDQPEDNLDNQSVFNVLTHFIRSAKKKRQIIVVTHNPNLAIGADAEQIIYVNLDKKDKCRFIYETGSIENPIINRHVVDILEGTMPAFDKRRLKYLR
ncbi:MAG: ABC transporter ATP-binding protein, partial [bacterium]